MSDSHPGVHASIPHQLVAIADRLKGIADPGELGRLWPQIAYDLDWAAARAAMARRREPIPGLEDALSWLESAVRLNAAFSDPACRALRAEAERQIRRIRG